MDATLRRYGGGGAGSPRRPAGPQALRPLWWAFGPIPGFAVRSVQHERATELLGITEQPGDRTKFAIYAAGLRAGSKARTSRGGPAERRRDRSPA